MICVLLTILERNNIDDSTQNYLCTTNYLRDKPLYI